METAPEDPEKVVYEITKTCERWTGGACRTSLIRNRSAGVERNTVVDLQPIDVSAKGKLVAAHGVGKRILDLVRLVTTELRNYPLEDAEARQPGVGDGNPWSISQRTCQRSRRGEKLKSIFE